MLVPCCTKALAEQMSHVYLLSVVGKFLQLEVLCGLATPRLRPVQQQQPELLPNSRSALPPIFCHCPQPDEWDRRAKIETLTQIREEPAFEAG